MPPIGLPPVPPPLDPFNIVADAGLTFIAVLLCLLIYLRTHELYDLTRHKGINYFRWAFLFFGLSLFLRFVSKVFFITRMTLELHFARPYGFPLVGLLLGYFSTVSIFFILRAAWKGLDDRKALFAIHSIAVLLSIITFFTRSHVILLYVQCALVIFAGMLLLYRSKGRQVIVLYILLGVLWLANILFIQRRRGPINEIEIIALSLSIAILGLLYYKVRKWTE